VSAPSSGLDAHTVVCDLDGVIWLADHAIAGSADAIARLRASGRRVLFVTNNSSVPVGAVVAKLEGFGIPAKGDVLTSAMAAARLIEPGKKAVVLGGPGVVEALEARGVQPLREGPADAVVVGFHRDFDYERMKVASDTIRGGAVLIGTNDDVTYPTPSGPIPGGGAILAAVATGAEAIPVVAGKPHPAMAALVREAVGDVRLLMVGDRPDTDGLFAVRLGCDFGLVLSGIIAPGTDIATIEPRPSIVANDLAALADALLADGGLTGTGSAVGSTDR
jgi:HAD superfamily hydrolase (TIGR01450 family)